MPATIAGTNPSTRATHVFCSSHWTTIASFIWWRSYLHRARPYLNNNLTLKSEFQKIGLRSEPGNANPEAGYVQPPVIVDSAESFSLSPSFAPKCQKDIPQMFSLLLERGVALPPLLCKLSQTRDAKFFLVVHCTAIIGLPCCYRCKVLRSRR